MLYSEKVMDHFSNPRNVGEIENADGIGEVGNAKCGDIMRIYLKIDGNIITDVKFKTFGCGAAVATSSMATEMIKGKTVEQAMSLTNKAVVEALDGLPAVNFTARFFREAVKAALDDYYKKKGINMPDLKPSAAAAAIRAVPTVMNKKVLIGMSGGVDSSACVYILKEQGYEVEGAYCVMHDFSGGGYDDAKKVADRFGIRLHKIDVRSAFEDIVVDNFLDCYQNGRTPNPCIICNPGVKFKALIEKADEIGAFYIATGHYANIGFENGRYYISAADFKDQSYMLYRLPQEYLKRIMFPLGNMDKTLVRKIAEENAIPSASKPDSQEICFIPDKDYAGFIEKRLGKFPEGDFISPEGGVCGKHNGIINYTVGQRKGLGIALGQPCFIRKIDPLKNEIYLSYRGGEYYSDVEFDNVVFQKETRTYESREYFAKVRYSMKTDKCTVKAENGKYTAHFSELVRAPAGGQSIVFYNERGEVLFGGFIK